MYGYYRLTEQPHIIIVYLGVDCSINKKTHHITFQKFAERL